MDNEEKQFRIKLAAKFLANRAKIFDESFFDIPFDRTLDIVDALVEAADRRYLPKDAKPDQVDAAASAIYAKASCWTDPETGYNWCVAPNWSGTHYETVSRFGDTLPTADELEAFEKGGGRKALGITLGWFWADKSAVHPTHPDSAEGLYGSNGDIYYDLRNLSGSALLVNRRK